MKIIIYNINSFGGNYEYAKCIFHAYSQNAYVSSCTLLMPANAEVTGNNILKMLYADIPASSNKFIRKLQYLYRSFVNPIRLYRYLGKQEAAIVLFNDFDQLTSVFWAPFYKRLKKKHQFAVMLHDPDRDKFFRFRLLSEYSMSSLMAFMDIAFYHGYLPGKKYYNSSFARVDVPHGTYPYTALDQTFLHAIRAVAGNQPLIGVLGNIREEKNYELIFDALAQLEKVKLLIAGKPAHSGISIEYLKRSAVHRGVGEKIIWITEYLSQEAFNAAVEACEIVLLYYKPSFTSQSGILNSIAPFAKKLVISDTESSLKKTVEKYGLGTIVPGNNVTSLVGNIQRLLTEDDLGRTKKWQQYIQHSSWESMFLLQCNTIKP